MVISPFEVLMPGVRALFLLLFLGSASLAADLRILSSGEVLQGELISIDAKNLVFRSEKKGIVTTPVADVLEVDLLAAPPLTGVKYIDVELTDGSLLHCSQFVLKGKTAEVIVLPSLPMNIPLSAITYVLNEAHDAKVRQEWQQFLGKRGNRDILAIKAEGVLNALEGTFGDGDAEGKTIAFELANGKKVQPNLSGIHGLIFFHKGGGQIPDTFCKVHDKHRNLLVASKAVLNDKGLAVTTLCDVRIDYPTKDLVSKFDFSKGKLTYLSDLEPVKVEETSTEDLVHHYRRDKNLDDGPIKLREKVASSKPGAVSFTIKTYPKGLAVHSRTILVYNIGGEYKDFKAIVGVDELVGGDSKVRLVITGDGRELFAREVKRGDDPYPLTIDIRNVKMLQITVSSDFLDLGNHLDLADAKVNK